MSTETAESAVEIPSAGRADTTTPAVPEASEGGRLTRWSNGFRSSRVLQIAALLIAVQMGFRAWVAFGGYFWQDDLVITGLAARHPLLSSDFLLYDQDGHFMPGGFLLTGILTRLAPLVWWPMALSLVILQALASLAVLRLLRLLFGTRPMLLAPLILYLFSPLSLTAFAWWIAAVNAVPLQAGLAWVVGDAILLWRTGRPRYAITGTAVFAASLVFFEKSLIIPLIAFAVVALMARSSGVTTPIILALKQGRWLWVGVAATVAVWAAVYVSVVGSPAVEAKDAGSVPQAVDLIGGGWLRGLLPALFGGPFSWADPGVFATPPTALVIASCVGVAAALAWTSRHRRGCGVIWWLFVAYLAINAAAMIVGRLIQTTPPQLSLSLRYYADTPLVLAIAVSLVLIAPAREDLAHSDVLTAQGRRVVALGAAVAYLAASSWSTATFMRVWTNGPTEAYLANAAESLRTVDAPLLDQGVPDTLLWPLMFPGNLASRVLAPIGGDDHFARATSDLRILDDAGKLAPAHVEELRTIEPGPLEHCGYGVSGGGTTLISLDGPLVPLEWTAKLNYIAGADGVLEVSLDDRPERVPVTKGINTVFLRVGGGGDTLRVRSQSKGLGVCIDSGSVGLVKPGIG